MQANQSCEAKKARGGWWEDTFAKNCNFPIAPINTFSNVAYALVGIFIMSRVHTIPALVFGIMMIILAIGSGLYHGFKTIPTSRLDHVGMYTVFGSLVIYALSPRHPFIGPLMAIGGVVLALTLAYSSNWKKILDVIMGVCVFLSTMAVALNNSVKPAIFSFTIFLIAYGIWNLDKSRKFFLPRWGHGLWHILTAVALGVLFLNIR